MRQIERLVVAFGALLAGEPEILPRLAVRRKDIGPRLSDPGLHFGEPFLDQTVQLVFDTFDPAIDVIEDSVEVFADGLTNDVKVHVAAPIHLGAQRLQLAPQALDLATQPGSSLVAFFPLTLGGDFLLTLFGLRFETHERVGCIREQTKMIHAAHVIALRNIALTCSSAIALAAARAAAMALSSIFAMTAGRTSTGSSVCALSISA